nr:MAG TPA: hypothetical protein [Caudoviricetes sp.]
MFHTPQISPHTTLQPPSTVHIFKRIISNISVNLTSFLDKSIFLCYYLIIKIS